MTKGKGKQHNLVGNIANQKYEATRNMERLLHIIHHTTPSHETMRWRVNEPYVFTKQEGRMVRDEKKINRDNRQMGQRLHQIVHESRGNAYEHAPGWRAGSGGAFIDCYPSTKHKEVLKNMAKNNNVARRFHEQRKDHENLLILKFLESARSSYGRKELKDKYERNRVAYGLFHNKTPHYALHLGLVRSAMEHMERTNKAHTPSQNPLSPSKNLFRPKSAPSLHNYDRQVLGEVDNIHDIHDFYDFKEIDRQLRNRQKDWDRTTNDNLFNSHYNIHDNKNNSIYPLKKSSFFKDIDYLSESVKVTDMMKQRAKEKKDGNKDAPFVSRDRENEGDRPATSQQRIDLLDVKPKTINRPQSGSGHKKRSTKKPPKITFDDKNGKDEGKDSAKVRIESGKSSPKAQKSSPSDGIQKLAMMRKNVSFKALNPLDGDEDDMPMAEEDSILSPVQNIKGPNRKGLSRGVSGISELGTDDDPTLPSNRNNGDPSGLYNDFGRKLSLALEKPATDNTYNRMSRVLSRGEGDELVTSAGEAEAISSQEILQSLKLYFQSKYNFPVRCQAIPYVYYKRLSLQKCSLEGVYIAMYDVGYFLPGNENGMRVLEDHLADIESKRDNKADDDGNLYHSNSVAHSPHNMYQKQKTGKADDIQVHYGKRIMSPKAAPSSVLKDIPGLSLPTTSGLLIIVHGGSEENEIQPAFEYLSVHQAEQASFSTYSQSLPHTVLNEMQNFAYAFGQDFSSVTPRPGVDTNRLRKEQAKEVVVIDEDMSRAMVYPCLLDMMDEEVMVGFVDAIVNRMEIQYDAQEKRLKMKC